MPFSGVKLERRRFHRLFQQRRLGTIMNMNRNCTRAALILFFTITVSVSMIAQSSKNIPRLAASAGIGLDDDDKNKNQRQDCCLQTATGEPGWTLVSAPQGVQTPHAAVILTPPNGLYAPALPGSAWVGPTAGSGLDDLPVGNYVYEFKFCLCHASHHQIHHLSLLFFSDNPTVSVTLNGGSSLIAPTPSVSFTNPPGPFPVMFPGTAEPHGVGKFRPCPEVNTLAITVDNEGGPTGLDAILSISGAIAGTDGRCDCKD
jgi:hypothetical protein